MTWGMYSVGAQPAQPPSQPVSPAGEQVQLPAHPQGTHHSPSAWGKPEAFEVRAGECRGRSTLRLGAQLQPLRSLSVRRPVPAWRLSGGSPEVTGLRWTCLTRGRKGSWNQTSREPDAVGSGGGAGSQGAV